MELAARALNVFATARPSRHATAAAYRADLIRLARKIVTLRPAMAPLQVAVAKLVEKAEVLTGNADTPAQRQRLAAALRELQTELDEAPKRVADRFSQRFRSLESPIVISYSSQVIAAFAALPKRSFSVTVCESRPRLEGRRTAKALQSMAHSVTVITEAQIGKVMRMADSVVLGCDAVRRDGSVVNKTGSYVLALTAREHRRRVIVLSSSYKLVDRVHDTEPQPPRDVWAGRHPGILVANDQFELVPAKLMSYIVFEDSVRRPDGLKRLWRPDKATAAALGLRR